VVASTPASRKAKGRRLQQAVRQDRRRFPSGLMIAGGQTVNRAAQWVIVQTKETDPKLIDKEVP